MNSQRVFLFMLRLKNQDWPAGLSVTSSIVRSTALLTRMPDSETGSLLSAAIEKGYTIWSLWNHFLK